MCAIWQRNAVVHLVLMDVVNALQVPGHVKMFWCIQMALTSTSGTPALTATLAPSLSIPELPNRASVEYMLVSQSSFSCIVSVLPHVHTVWCSYPRLAQWK